MAIISEVKCGRCDRRYSGLRSRCPYCGARRNKRGKHAEDTENNRGKIIIGVLLLVVFAAGALILIITSASKGSSTAESANSAKTSASAKPTFDEGVTAVVDSNNVRVSPSATVSASPSDGANAKITAVKIMVKAQGVAATDVTIDTVGKSVQFSFATTPDTTGKVGIWKSSDLNVFNVVDGKVTTLGKGTATLSVTVDGIPAQCIIRVT